MIRIFTFRKHVFDAVSQTDHFQELFRGLKVVISSMNRCQRYQDAQNVWNRIFHQILINIVVLWISGKIHLFINALLHSRKL
mmetsp:Transcript_7709/g.10267  ORF Transcript_7709/g.10267 Transcript_7709/m.10267 type:complete len:82 (-) Transcript_7709:50-295(-)